LTAVADAALFLHLVGALLFVAGIIVAGIAHAAGGDATVPVRCRCFSASPARARCSSPPGVLLLAFGVWLVDLRGHSLGELWIAGALTLALALVLGTLGGRRPRQARFRAG
jgi:hypothetical protein